MLTELNPPRPYIQKPLELTTDFMQKLDALTTPEEGLPLLIGSVCSKGEGGNFLLKVTNKGAVFISNGKPSIDPDNLDGAYELCCDNISGLVRLVNMDAITSQNSWELCDLPRYSELTTFTSSETFVSETPNTPIELGRWVQLYIAHCFSREPRLTALSDEYRINPDNFTLASKALALKPDAICPPEAHIDTLGAGMILTAKIMGAMGCGEMRIHIPFAQCYADPAFQSEV